MPRRLDDKAQKSAAERLADDGFAIIPAYLSGSEVDVISTSLRALQDKVEFGCTEFAGWRTKRAFALIGKTRALDGLLLDPSILALVRGALGGKGQLSIASTMEIYPGEVAQPLHQDDFIYGCPNPHLPLVVNTLWALTPFTAENGATRLVPKSHLREGVVDPKAETIAAEMPVGSVLVWNGALWHGGGANRSAAPRLGLSINYCQAYLRQQENQYLATPAAAASGLPEAVAKMIGYSTSEFLGYVDNVHPSAILSAYRREQAPRDGIA